MSKHHGILEECILELEKSIAGLDVKMKLETWLVRLKQLLLQNESKLYSMNSPCTVYDLAQLRDKLSDWNNSSPTSVTVREIEAHILGLVRLLERE
jgi:hypothetical protein